MYTPDRGILQATWVSQDEAEVETVGVVTHLDERVAIDLLLAHHTLIRTLVSPADWTASIGNELFSAYDFALEEAWARAVVADSFITRNMLRIELEIMPALVGGLDIELARFEIWVIGAAYRAFSEGLYPTAIKQLQGYPCEMEAGSLLGKIREPMKRWLERNEWIPVLEGYTRILPLVPDADR